MVLRDPRPGPCHRGEQAQVGRRLRHRGNRQGRTRPSSYPCPARRIRQPVNLDRRGLPGGMGRGARLDRETQDARRIPPRHRSLHRAPHRPDASSSPAPGGDLQALPRTGRARRPRRPASVCDHGLPHPSHPAQGTGRRRGRRTTPCHQPGRTVEAPPRASQAEPIQVWTVEQLGSFLDTARSHRLSAFYRLAAYSGARRGELLYLRWEAIHLDAAEVTFGGSTAVARGQRVEGTTKGGRSRTISLDRDTVAVLREHRRQQAEERLAAGSAWNDTDGLVFVTRWGEPLYPTP
jgi:hypothetical protein